MDKVPPENNCKLSAERPPCGGAVGLSAWLKLLLTGLLSAGLNKTLTTVRSVASAGGLSAVLNILFENGFCPK